MAPGALYGSRGAEGGVIRVNSLVVLISMVLGGDRYNWYSPLPLSAPQPLPVLVFFEGHLPVVLYRVSTSTGVLGALE